MSDKKLPKDWKWAKLKEICEVVTGTTPPKSDMSNYGNEIPFFKPPHLWDGLISETEEMLSLKGATKARVVPPNTVLVTCIGNLGRTGLVRKEAAFNQQINAILENDKIDGKYIFYQAQSPSFRNQLEKLATGTTVSIVNKENFKTITIPLAPIETQQAIVSKIEELFSELDKGIEDLKTAQQQLKTYRQSVLKWAFEGKLTNENVKDGELPESWECKTLGELGKWKGGGTPSRQNKSFWENGTNLWVSSKDMKLKKINDSIDKITDEAIIKSSAKIISKGAIMFVMRSGILRHTLPVAIAGKDLTVNQDLQTVEPFEYIASEYLYWFIIGNNQKIRQECSKDGTTVESIDTTSLKKYNVPIAPIEEQHLIVQQIDSRLSVANKMEESIFQSLQQAEALRQSILKKAFSGELV